MRHNSSQTLPCRHVFDFLLSTTANGLDLIPSCSFLQRFIAQWHTLVGPGTGFLLKIRSGLIRACVWTCYQCPMSGQCKNTTAEIHWIWIDRLNKMLNNGTETLWTGACRIVGQCHLHDVLLFTRWQQWVHRAVQRSIYKRSLCNVHCRTMQNEPLVWNWSSGASVRVMQIFT